MRGKQQRNKSDARPPRDQRPTDHDCQIPAADDTLRSRNARPLNPSFSHSSITFHHHSSPQSMRFTFHFTLIPHRL
ncbi:hypothetical protein L2E82_25936 [Cichorium intybus]|uniref:Uncharacterized protein n=1 Tax=Cichorium intybus TaxID=13427 RepID=A0ACB9E4X7_CICIN|nr:hypothetical protein L2E82_25936 [Cichorium intybus]